MDISWFRVQTDTEELASKIKSSDNIYDHLLCIARGGLVIGGLLSHYVPFKRISSIKLRHYQGHQAMDHVEELTPPCAIQPGEKVLLVDDLIDTGETVKYVLNKYSSGIDIDVAVLYDKTEGKFSPTFFVEEAPNDEWITFPWEIGDE